METTVSAVVSKKIRTFLTNKLPLPLVKALRYMIKSILYFLFILFIEITCGFGLLLLYSLLSFLLFAKNDFAHSRLNEAITYMVTLLPPFLYCLMLSSRFKTAGNKNMSAIYLSAGVTYLAGGFIFLLIVTGFYLLGN